MCNYSEMSFIPLLANAGINKAELARLLHITPRTVSAWGEEAPTYVKAYLYELGQKQFLENGLNALIAALNNREALQESPIATQALELLLTSPADHDRDTCLSALIQWEKQGR